MVAAQGFQAKLGIGAASPVTIALDFQSETLALAEAFVDTNGLRGTRSRDLQRVRSGLRRVAGAINLQPTAVELSNILQWILGGTPVGTNYPLADTSIDRVVSIDRVQNRFEYSGCKVDRGTFRAAQGGPLEVILDLVGVEETVSGTAFPALTLDTTTVPFMFHECVLNVGGSNYSVPEVEVVVDNRIDAERFFNSRTLTQVNPQDRAVSFSTRLPYGDASAVYGTGLAGVAVTATFTSGATSLVLSMSKVVFGAQSPQVPGRVEILFPVQGQAFRNGATLELVTTLDSTP